MVRPCATMVQQVHQTGRGEDDDMSRQQGTDQDRVPNPDLDWDAVLAEPQRAEPQPAEAAAPAVPADAPVLATYRPSTADVLPVPEPEPDGLAPVSLGAGWTVLPKPGRWGGTLRISDAARARALADQSERTDPEPRRGDEVDRQPDPAGDETAGHQTAGPELAAPCGRRRASRRSAPEDPGQPDDVPVRRPTAEDLTADLLVRDHGTGPRTGLRGFLYRASGGALHLRPSAAEQRERALMRQVRRPMDGCFRVAVVSLKGGVGKTTATFCLGATLASLRGDRVIAIDANPDVGTLAEHVVHQTRSNVWDLLADPDSITRYSQVRSFTSQSPDRLEVLASARDPQLSQAFDAGDYEQVVAIAERFYSMVVTDCGTGMVHSAMTGVLASVDQLVLVSSASLDGARSASATLDWLEAQGHGALATEACVVINSVRSRSAEVDVERLSDHFRARTRAVVTVPYDPHLARGTSIELDGLQGRTRRAWVELAAEVVADLG
jgi:MinD-like ATPase involved in chromosome partitioning or flagellar assembly